MSVINSEPRSAVTKVVSDAKAVSTYDPNSKVETTIQPPSGALSGAKITLPAGALAIAVDLVIEESVPMSETSVASSLNLRQDITIEPIGAGLIIRPSQNVDLTRPLTIAMSLESISGLRSWLQKPLLATSGDYYAVFYKSMIAGELRAGVIPTSSLRFSEDGKVLFEGYFGAFWLCKVSSPIEERIEVHTDEPTVNANHVSVIESTGIVTEASIAAKAAIPEVVWTGVQLIYNAELRTGTLSANIGAGRSLQSCQVDLRASVDESSGTNEVADTNLSFNFPIVKKSAHSLVGRFRCLDDQGRLTISRWSTVLQVPSEPDPAVATSIFIDEAAIFTSSAKVSLDILASGATEMYLTEKTDCGTGGSWEAYSTTKTWTLTQSNGQAQIFAKFRNVQGHESACISATIIHDSIPPTGLNLSINGGSSYTSSLSVSLIIQGTAASQMYLTNSAACSAGGTWTSFSPSTSWTLAQNNSTATVYAKFKDLAGNESSCISGSIIHDSIAPTAGSLAINSGASSSTSSAVSLNLSASAANEMYITNSSACSAGGVWESYGTSKTWTLSKSSGIADVYVKFRDYVGNESSCISDSITISAPQVSTTMQVKGGTDHTCVLLSNGQIKCWGYNYYGQLGLGNTTNHGTGPNEMGSNLLPVDLGTNRSATAIAAGQLHTCAILDNGAVKCWGHNGEGELGLGHTNRIGDQTGEMGDNLPELDLGTGRTALAISSLYYHTCALLDNHSVKCWGYGAWGNLGYGDSNNQGTASNQMGDALPAVDLGTGRTAKSISAGIHHTCAVLDNDSVKCWGYNSEGALGQENTNQIGDNPSEMGDNLLPISLGSGRSAKSISAGHVHTCAVLDTHEVKCWGSNYHGESGLENNSRYGDNTNEMGDSLPVVSLGTGRTALDLLTSVQQTCALLDNATIKCWGYNAFGQLGNGTTMDRGLSGGEMGDALAEVDLGTGRSALAMGGGWHHNCAILDNQSIKCWGYNNNGQLGLGHNSYVGDNAGEMGDALPTINLLSDIPESGLKLWLRADTGLYQDSNSSNPAIAMNDPIAKWEDRSGHGGHMTVASTLDPTSARPLLNTNSLNGHSTVTFDGTSNLQNLVSYTHPNTIFILARYTGSPQGRILSGTNNNWLLGWYAGSENAFYAGSGWVSAPSGAAGFDWDIYAGEQTSSSQSLFHNNQLIAATSLGGASGPDGLSLGGWSSCCYEYSASEIAEVIIYNRVLSAAERTEIFLYLNQRYALNP